MSQRLLVTYLVRADADAIDARADMLALEQSVELPRSAFDEPRIHETIVGRVERIEKRDTGHFAVDVSLAAETAPPEAGQLLNMLFGNSSLQDDVTLSDVRFPVGYAGAFGGPRQGLVGLRAKTRAEGRALTASALKPQGLASETLARLAGALALGGLDIVKDDHGLADQAFSPFAERVARCAAAVRAANARTGRRTLYAPSLSGSLDALRAQMRVVSNEGVEAVLVAPMVLGLPAFHAIRAAHPDIVFLTHPSMGGAARIAPPFLLGRLFRMLGGDAIIFPNYGGRFSYSPDTCRAIANAALAPWPDEATELGPAVPAPAGGMTLDRVPELLSFYGRDVVLLIGGSLLAARDELTAAAAAFQQKVESYVH